MMRLSPLLAQLETESWIDLLLGPAGLLVGLILTVWAFATRRVIARGIYEEMRDDRDRWRQIALTGLNISEQAVDIVRAKMP